MEEELKNPEQKNALDECAAKLSSTAQALERVIGKLEAQYEALNQKIDRIIATVEKQAADEKNEKADLAAGADPAEQGVHGRHAGQRSGRKTLPTVVTTLLAKSGVGEGAEIAATALDKALGALTIEQRIAVKAELARAGLIA